MNVSCINLYTSVMLMTKQKVSDVKCNELIWLYMFKLTLYASRGYEDEALRLRYKIKERAERVKHGDE